MVHDPEKDGTPTLTGKLVGSFNHLGIARSVDYNVRLFPENFHDRPEEVGFPAIEGMGSPELLGHIQLMGMKVCSNDRMGSGKVCPKNYAKSDPTTTDDHYGFPDLEVSIIIDKAKSGCKRVSEKSTDFHAGAPGNRSQPIFRDNGMLVEGGDPAGVNRLAVPAVFGRCSFNPGARPPMQDDLVTLLDRLDPGPVSKTFPPAS